MSTFNISDLRCEKVKLVCKYVKADLHFIMKTTLYMSQNVFVNKCTILTTLSMLIEIIRIS